MSKREVVEREPISVQFVAAASDEIEDIQRAWSELESIVELHGRRFYGAYYPSEREYRACVELRESDQPVAGIPTGTLPGGHYLRERLTGEPPAVYERIRPTFEELVQHADPDPSRPSLELYRRRDEIDLLLAVHVERGA